MQVAAGWIDAKGPPRVAISLPGGQAHRITQEPANRIRVQWRRDFAVNSPIETGVRPLHRRKNVKASDPSPLLVVRKRDQRRAGIPAERIRLRRPIQVPARARESTEIVLGGLVVFE